MFGSIMRALGMRHEIVLSENLREELGNVVALARWRYDDAVRSGWRGIQTFIPRYWPLLFCRHYHCGTRMIPVGIASIIGDPARKQYGYAGCSQIICPTCLHNETDPCTNGND